ncbi:MAG: DegT/DnrJ/EryC1/StrS family aminotransferase [Acidobacteria bacterium]|nr:DegT/DnrJ/EryC1/StrS family aminotransferase [Acidobacteriota bacterium]
MSEAAEEITMGSPSIAAEDLERVSEVLRSGRLREGPLCREFEEAFAAKVGARFAVSVNSGTAALHLAYLSLLEATDARGGDEVLVPSFTFIATASMVVAAGARPLFCDVDPKTFTLDGADAERRITPKTKLIAGVHLFGNSCDVSGYQALAERRGLRIVWDAAQAQGTRFEGNDVGGFPDAVCFSFYPSKNMTTGEGGMIATSDAALYEKCLRLRNHGQGDEYIFPELGFNYRMTDIQAALGLGQLKRLDEFLRRRRENAEFLSSRLKEVDGLTVPYVSEGVEHSYNQFSVLLTGDSPEKQRTALRRKLQEAGVPTAVYYPSPLHVQPAFAPKPADPLPVSEDLAGRILSLPVHPQLTKEQLEKVVEELKRNLNG